MKKYLSIIATVSVSLFMTGCIKETLPQGSTQTASQVSNSQFALSGLINSIAGQMTEFNATGYYSSYSEQMDFGMPALHLAMEYMLEDCVLLGEPGYNQFYYYYYNLYQGKDYIYCAYFWSCYYTWLKACNDAVKLIGEPTEATMAYLGQAHAWRAYCYLDMARLFEPKENDFTDVSAVKYLTVPYVDENSTEEQARNNPRLTRDEMYKRIFADLDKAEECLLQVKTSSYKAPSLAVVYGLKARAFLEQGYWSKEAGYSKAADYADAFAKAEEFAAKAIEASRCTPLTQTQWEDPSNGFNSGTSNNAWMLALTIDSQNTNNLCNFTAMFSNEALFGYGPYIVAGMMPSTYAKMSDSDWRKHSYIDPSFEGDPEGLTGEYKLSGQPDDQAENASNLADYPCASLKFRPAEGACSDDNKGVAADHCLMRVEEMYFIEAEAKAHSNLGEAKAILEGFLNGYRYVDGSYVCNASDLNEFLDELLLQKRFEFWGEGILFFDYKRLGAGIERDSSWPSNICFNTKGSRSSQWNICITRSETQQNVAIGEDFNNPDPTKTMVVE